jgi:hypothetical protein
VWPGEAVWEPLPLENVLYRPPTQEE